MQGKNQRNLRENIQRNTTVRIGIKTYGSRLCSIVYMELWVILTHLICIVEGAVIEFDWKNMVLLGLFKIN